MVARSYNEYWSSLSNPASSTVRFGYVISPIHLRPNDVTHVDSSFSTVSAYCSLSPFMLYTWPPRDLTNPSLLPLTILTRPWPRLRFVMLSSACSSHLSHTYSRSTPSLSLSLLRWTRYTIRAGFDLFNHRKEQRCLLCGLSTL